MISKILLALIRRFEGLFLKVYRCPAGVPSIGYGHTGKDVYMGMAPISEAVAEGMLHQDAALFVQAASNLSPVLWFDENKQAAISDFCFNLGTTRYKSSTLKRKVDAGDWGGAQAELMKWVWGGGKKLPGLVARRAEEARLLRS